jgi:hypothetical protein
MVAEKKATQRADAALHRQQETEQPSRRKQAQAALLGKVEDLATRGDELYEDFQESVVDAGMRGDWDLSQPTFEAAHEAENGAQILYELSQDKKEAKRVASFPLPADEIRAGARRGDRRRRRRARSPRPGSLL